ncbi:manganese efflux pump [Alicyclobacillus curvatus]|nr:manganese efflux pump [Alicyclobacillus curvatus]
MDDIIEILMMAVALGMDAFSLAIGIGLKGISRQRAILLCLAIGLFHVVLTLVGIYTGMMLQDVLGKLAKWFGSFLLFGLGLHMLFSTLFGKDEDDKSFNATYMGMILFGIGVSIDALSVGFSLGLRSTAFGLVAAATFGFFGMVMCGAGLVVGRRVNRMAGVYGEVLGAIILIGYGFYFLLK